MFFNFLKMEVYLIYSIVLVSDIWQSDSVICVPVYIYNYYVYVIFRFFSLVGYCKTLSTIPCTIQ